MRMYAVFDYLEGGTGQCICGPYHSVSVEETNNAAGKFQLAVIAWDEDECEAGIIAWLVDGAWRVATGIDSSSALYETVVFRTTIRPGQRLH
jgi:hypothetical protein